MLIEKLKTKIEQVKSKESDQSSGSFDFGDEPLRILNARVCTDVAREQYRMQGFDNVDVVVTIEWAKRADGTKPANTSYPNFVVKEECPKLLVEFYESRISSSKTTF